MALLARQPSVRPWTIQRPLPRLLVPSLPFPYNRATQTYLYCTTTSYIGDSLQDGSTPSVVVGDAFIYARVTSPSGYAITVAGDGTFTYDTGGDSSRQSFAYSVWRRASNTVDGPATFWVNNTSPAWLPLPAFEYLVGAAVSIDLSAYCTDAESDALTFSILSGALPNGLSLVGATITGMPLTVGASTLVIRATDITGDHTDSATISFSIVSISLPDTPVAYVMNLELYETEQGEVALYWLLPQGLSQGETVTFSVLINGSVNQTVGTAYATVSDLVSDTDYVIKVQANFAAPVQSREFHYSYSSRNAEVITPIERLKPFPTTQLP